MTAAQLSNQAATERFDGSDRQAIATYQRAILQWGQCRSGVASGTTGWIDDTMREADDAVAVALALRDTGGANDAAPYATQAEDLILLVCPLAQRMNVAQSIWLTTIAPFYYQRLTAHFAQSRNPKLEQCLRAAAPQRPGI